MHEIWYDYAKPKYEKNKQNYVISIYSPPKGGKKFTGLMADELDRKIMNYFVRLTAKK